MTDFPTTQSENSVRSFFLVHVKFLTMYSSYIFGILGAILLVEGHFETPYECPFLARQLERERPFSYLFTATEEDSVGLECIPQNKTCDPNDIYYSMDGSCNNLKNPIWGRTKTPFARLLNAHYSDGFSKFRTSVVDGSPLPLPREIRKALLPSENVPSKRLNIWFYGFGQLLDHDITLAISMNTTDKCCVNNQPAANMNISVCLPVIMQKDDAFYSQFNVTCIEFKRAMNTEQMKCDVKPINQINSQTPFLDISIFYGASEADMKKQRLGTGGQLKVLNNDSTSGQDFPQIVSNTTNCPFGGVNKKAGGYCFLAGDRRINQNPEILLVDVVLLKLHNKIAKQLQSLNPRWNDDKLFKETRRICIAMYQHVVMAEYLPILIGPKYVNMYKLLPAFSGYNYGYDQDLPPQTLASYSSAFGRAGHSTVVGSLKYQGPTGRTESYKLRDKYFNNSFLLGNNMFTNVLQEYLKQASSEQDQIFTQELNNWMFRFFNDPFGFDLSALDILRGRDFGLQSYNNFREVCGLRRLTCFEDLIHEIKRPQDIQALKAIYKSVDDIDLYVGGLLEKAEPGSTFGPTFSCLHGESFKRIKYGDRRFYEFPGAKYTPAQLEALRKTTMSGMLCLTNPTLKSIQKNSFLVECNENPRMQCTEITTIDLEPWREI